MLNISEAVKKRWNEYKYVLLVLAIGVLLLALPHGSSNEESSREKAECKNDEEWLQSVEKEMESVLSRIDGAGKLSLMLTVERGKQSQLAKDRSITHRGDEASESTETVIVSEGSSQQSAVTTTADYPLFRGCIVVCEGGNVASVRLAITEAVSALTGLSSDKITVVKGN